MIYSRCVPDHETQRPGNRTRRKFVGGMRSGRLNWSAPFARLTIDPDGIAVGPSMGFGVPHVAIAWEHLTRIEPLGFTLLPVLGEGVRFVTFIGGVIFWTGSRGRSRAILDRSAQFSHHVAYTRQRPPLSGVK